MDLSDIQANVADQDRGRWFELRDPVTGAATGMRFLIAGPDSATQRRAELQMADDLAEMAGPDGRVTAEHRETIRLNALARCVLGWEISENGEPVPFGHKAVLRVLSMAKWVHAQVDSFASERGPIDG